MSEQEKSTFGRINLQPALKGENPITFVTGENKEKKDEESSE